MTLFRGEFGGLLRGPGGGLSGNIDCCCGARVCCDTAPETSVFATFGEGGDCPGLVDNGPWELFWIGGNHWNSGPIDVGSCNFTINLECVGGTTYQMDIIAVDSDTICNSACVITYMMTIISCSPFDLTAAVGHLSSAAEDPPCDLTCCTVSTDSFPAVEVTE